MLAFLPWRLDLLHAIDEAIEVTRWFRCFEVPLLCGVSIKMLQGHLIGDFLLDAACMIENRTIVELEKGVEFASTNSDSRKLKTRRRGERRGLRGLACLTGSALSAPLRFSIS
jgi:hypothetical protein